MTERALLAGGCFWCMEQPFAKLEGVLSVKPGYIGGEVSDPSYEQVCSGRTGHTEAVEVQFDPDRISYAEILEVFWRQIDPTDVGGQFADRGSQYRTGIYPIDAEQQKIAEDSKRKLAESGLFAVPIATEIVPAGPFYPAEEYHREYYRKNPLRYQLYRQGSGRERYLDEVWGGERVGRVIAVS